MAKQGQEDLIPCQTTKGDPSGLWNEEIRI